MTLTDAVPLSLNQEQRVRLQALQDEFSRACNIVAPVAQAQRCWNRVALHHLTYRTLRDQLPGLGAQMACNAIYAVCRAYRALYQMPAAPWSGGDTPLPLVRFAKSAPVFFDRHTLTVKPGSLSLFTMEGRLRFQLTLSEQLTWRFANLRLREVILLGSGEDYSLRFIFLDEGDDDGLPNESWPDYLVIVDPLLREDALGAMSARMGFVDSLHKNSSSSGV
ncbi:hypothetical protein [Chitinilyticum litopenaei]|uniref:hypothetical protein n=1 Tax=Chitinilyticum litopenaei TaxID=1121276 RepID=UPI001B7FACFC|nr:hypothetical protein [Chitinilyticum litopenaei]